MENTNALAPAEPSTASSAPRVIPRSVWVCALLSAAARFAPLPFLDDFIIGRIQRHLVATALKRHGRALDRHQVAPLYEDPQGCVAGCLSLLVELPLAILLLTGPVVFGLAGTVLPAFGYLPALGGDRFTLAPFAMLFAEPGILSSLAISLLAGLASAALSLVVVMLFVAAFAGTRAAPAGTRKPF